jgi:DNA-binding HxlR family transcriptional regulator
VRVITLRFGAEDPLRCRFAISPLWETVNALDALLRPSRHAVHVPWLRAARGRLDGVDLGPLADLLTAAHNRYVPDFVTPPPESPIASIEEEIERVRATPPRMARAELALAFGDRPRGAGRRALLADPADAVRRVADALAVCWDRLLSQDWPRVRDLLEADIVHRARQLTAGGMASVLDDLHPQVRWRASAVRVNVSYDQTVELAGRGLLFLPSAFVWPKVFVVTDPPWQPTLVYPARGVGLLWARPRSSADALTALVGRTRGLIAAALAEPATTTQLAARLGLAAGTVSEHLAVLRDAGLATPQRTGRSVHYALTPLGHALVASAGA